jgi:hypothetical protein
MSPWVAAAVGGRTARIDCSALLTDEEEGCSCDSEETTTPPPAAAPWTASPRPGAVRRSLIAVVVERKRKGVRWRWR